MVAPQLARFDLWVHPLSESDDDGDVARLPPAARPAAAGDDERRAAAQRHLGLLRRRASRTSRPTRRRATLVERQLTATAALGITTVVAAGDSGSSACARGVPADQLTSSDKKPQVVVAGDARRGCSRSAARTSRSTPDNTIASTGRLERHRLPGAVHQDGGRRRRAEHVREAARGGSRRSRSRAPSNAWCPTSPRSPTRAPATRSSAPAASRAAAARARASPSSAARAPRRRWSPGMIALWNQQARNQGLPKPGFVAAAALRDGEAQPAGVPRRHRGHQRAVRRLLLPGAARLRPRHRLGLADRQHASPACSRPAADG